jgi:hypothetical protein
MDQECTMTTQPSQNQGDAGRDVAQTWAKPVDKLKVSATGSGAINLNVDGRQLSSPLRGFGQMWQKTYRIRFEGKTVPPQDVIKIWKKEFPNFWPEGNHFYGRVEGIVPGDVALLNIAGPGGIQGPGGTPLISTGVMVIYADEESFSFMTPEGHMFAGMITFSAFEEEGTVAQIQALIRANDPIFELSLRMGIGHKAENEFWRQTLKNLAAYFGAGGEVELKTTLVDPHVQWSEARNVWRNAAIRTGIYLMLTPVRWAGGLFRRKVNSQKA